MRLTLPDGSQQDVQITISYGAPHGVTAQVDLVTTTARQLFDARPTRRNAAVFNMSDSDDVLWGYGAPPDDAEQARLTGYPLPRRAAYPIDTTMAVWAIAVSGTPRVAYAEGYD